MRVTYYALKPVRVGDEVREVGDLVPEAADWVALTGYLSEARLAPVLVATLPEEQQMMLLEWEEEQEQAKIPEAAPEDSKESKEGTNKGQKQKPKSSDKAVA